MRCGRRVLGHGGASRSIGSGPTPCCQGRARTANGTPGATARPPEFRRSPAACSAETTAVEARGIASAFAGPAPARLLGGVAGYADGFGLG
ncbi:hypothetical protein GCM10009830_29850 [Glycomyces endophyticus]|uniref:Uncharacterized protein n=1 Tax=Glycomyces endophyticus TaxID=480996 RepID=A0ABN2H2V6_9ACTN